MSTLPADPLWQRLRHWRPETEGFARTLTHRVCQRTGWRAAYAQRVIEEYRRFLWLLIRHQGALCPSEAVDTVWHEHLLDSATYFERFCPQVLGQTLHHVPARGGEDALHRQRYRATLRAYAQAFGQRPPADIWPSPRRRWRSGWGLPVAWPGKPLAVTLGAALAAGCAQLTGRDLGLRLTGPVFLLLFVLALLALAIYATYLHRSFRPSRRARGQAPALTPEEVAFLAGGPWRVAQTCAARLWQGGHIRWQPTDAPEPAAGRWVAGDTPVTAHASAAECSVLAALLQGHSGSATVQALKTPIAHMQQHLWRQGMLHTPRRSHWWRDPHAALLVALYAGLFALGLARLVSGVGLGQPVFMLAGLLLVMGCVLPWLWWRHRRPTRLSRQGWRMLRALRRQLRGAHVQALDDERLPLAVAVLGASALAAHLQPLAHTLAPPAPARGESGSGCGGCGSSSGAGGDGCGGGCGGCGG